MTTIIDDFIAPPCLQDIEILSQNKHFLVINKPSGLLSLSGKNPLNKDSVHHRLLKIYPDAKMVHRLDLGTSGIMLIALNKTINAHLAKQFQDRTVVKTYISVVTGHVSLDEGRVNAPIAKDPALFPRLKVCHTSGKPAHTEFTVIDRMLNPPSTRIKFVPLTGRTHQLRIHSEYMGHPILGCDLYGNLSTHAASARLMLHAESLAFTDPISQQRILVECPCPF